MAHVGLIYPLLFRRDLGTMLYNRVGWPDQFSLASLSVHVVGSDPYDYFWTDVTCTRITADDSSAVLYYSDALAQNGRTIHAMLYVLGASDDDGYSRSQIILLKTTGDYVFWGENNPPGTSLGYGDIRGPNPDAGFFRDLTFWGATNVRVNSQWQYVPWPP